MKQPSKPFSNLRLLGLVPFALILTACSAENEPAEADDAGMFPDNAAPVAHPTSQEGRRMAAEGDADYQYMLGLVYDGGLFEITEDYAEAARWYRLAADQGITDAQRRLGGMFALGEGVTQDYAESVKWYRLAADQGDAASQYSLGLRYMNGQGVPQNDLEAVKWFRLAANQGYAQGQAFLASMYSGGRGVPQDDIEALKWTKLAAEQGHVNSQVIVGGSYVNSQDFVAAYAWLDIAVASEDESAALFVTALETRSDLEGLMTPAQIAEAQQLSTEIFERIQQGN